VSESELVKEFISICGIDNISTNEMDIVAYTSDLASLPPLIKQVYKIKSPKYVVRPSTTEQVSKIIKLAVERNIPFTSRAGASSGSGAIIPIDGGIVLDLTQMQKILKIDENLLQATVQPGITWAKFNFQLNKAGLMVGVHPSSSPSATVGGFISTGGYAGIGAPKYGAIAQQIQKLKVVFPTGEVLDVYPPFTSLFTGAEGTLGVITEITMRLYPLSQSIFPLAFGFSDISSFISSLDTTLKDEIRPYHVMVLDRHFLDVSKSLGMDVPKDELLVLFTLEGPESLIEVDLANIRTSFPEGSELSKNIAKEGWERRFSAELFIKRAGPSLILIEIGAPLKIVPQIYKTFQELGTEEKVKIGFCGILGHGATMLCMPFILTDERKGMDYLKVLSFSRKLISNAIKIGGVPYGIGLWGSPYLSFIYDQEHLKVLSAIKKSFDPKNLCNPGKITEDRTPEQMRPPNP